MLTILIKGTIVIRKWLELLTIDLWHLLKGELKILDFFDFFVFFKTYFDHVPDCILVWKFFTIFFDPCRINKKIFEPIGRYRRRQTICALDVKLLVRPTLHKTQFFLRHPVNICKVVRTCNVVSICNIVSICKVVCTCYVENTCNDESIETS